MAGRQELRDKSIFVRGSGHDVITVGHISKCAYRKTIEQWICLASSLWAQGNLSRTASVAFVMCGTNKLRHQSHRPTWRFCSCSEKGPLSSILFSPFPPFWWTCDWRVEGEVTERPQSLAALRMDWAGCSAPADGASCSKRCSRVPRNSAS